VIVLDSGADRDVVHVSSWHVTHRYSGNAFLRGAAATSAVISHPIVDALAAFDHPNGDTYLISMVNVALDMDSSQTESLLNTHHMRACGVALDDKIAAHGGTQSFTVDDITVPLQFVGGSTLQLAIRKPTNNEINNCKQLLVCNNRYKLRRQKSSVLPWQQIFSHIPIDVVNKTLQSTTQLASQPIEPESRLIPRQYRAQRAQSLHPVRLPGRVDTDPFYSTIPSVRGFKCLQLFVHVDSKFIWGKLMRREALSSGAYQDFIRNVGAPNLLVSDNSKNQAGNKWRDISRTYCIKHNFTAPKNQNQSHAERNIGTMKRHTFQLLWSAKAPLSFWCYALMFAIDTWNYSAKRKLGWATPIEKLRGNTPDISMFRFSWFQPVWFFEPMTKFPDHPFKAGFFVGIAWDHGDPFTYRIWQPTGNDVEKGRELIRNIVKPRDPRDDATPPTITDDDVRRLATLDLLRDPPGKPKPGTNLLPPKPVDPALRELIADALAKMVVKQNTITNSSTNNNIQNTSNTPIPDGVTAIPDDNVDPAFPPDDWFGHPNVVHDDDDESVGGGEHLDDGEISSSLDDSAADESDKQPMQQGDGPVADAVVDDNVDEHKDVIVPDAAEQGSVGKPDSLAERQTDELFQTAIESRNNDDNDNIISIVSHRYDQGTLFLKVQWSTEEHTWERYDIVRGDAPRLVAEYIVRNKPTRDGRPTRQSTTIYQWAKHVLRSFQRRLRRVVSTFEFGFNANDDIVILRRRPTVGNAKKRKGKKKEFFARVFQYGVEVPRNRKHADQLDKANGDTMWADASDKEITALCNYDCFIFKAADFKPGPAYQRTNLRLIYAVKQDLRRKARLVAGGHLIHLADNIRVYSSTVKTLSVRALDVIAHRNGLKQLCGDVGNAFVNADTQEKIFCIAGPEFGDRAGCVIILKKALYGLRSSAERFHAHFANTLRSMQFKPCRHDQDVWLRRRDCDGGYDYICTHVDDFKIVARDPQQYMTKIQAVYTIKAISEPDYYLGNDYRKNSKGIWSVGCDKYIANALGKIEQRHGSLRPAGVPLRSKDHPEHDDSPLLHPDQHQFYQQLIGMLNWVVQLGRFDVAFATASLSRFSASPRDGHLERVLRVWGYLKGQPSLRITINSDPPRFEGFGPSDLDKDLQKELSACYPDATEEVDPNVPKPFYPEIQITAFVDSDHAHDLVTRRSISGMILFLGRTPVYYSSKRQSSVTTSTYGAEFNAMRSATEEIFALRYALRSMGVHVSSPTKVFGDNMAVILNTTIADSLLTKKHIAISYHMVREAVAAGVVQPIKIDTKENYADMLTKALASTEFRYFVTGIFC